MEKKKYAITLKAYATIVVEADDPSDAEEIVLDNFKEGRESLIFSIDNNGYEAEYNDSVDVEDYE